MVLLAVVAGARVFAAANHYTEVYVARSALVPGEHLAAADVRVGEVRLPGEAAHYVAAGAAPVGYLVTRYVAAGELVPLGAVSAAPPAVDASRFVTVPVPAGHLPGDLGHGDLVDVYVTAKDSGSDAPTTPSLVIGGVPVDAADGGTQSLSGSSAVPVVLVVPASKVSAVVAAVETGAIDLIRVPATTTMASRP